MIRPIDGNEVSQEEIDALKPKPEEKSDGSEAEPTPETEGKAPEGDEKKEEVTSEGAKVPFHEDPAVQAYIERQVQKRLGEGNKAWEDRLNRIEQSITKKPEDQPSIFGGMKLQGNDAQIAKAIVLQAKKELLEDLQKIDGENKAQIEEEDREFAEFVGELRVTGVLKSDKDEIEFARLIAEYKLDDKDSAIRLWNKIQEGVEKAKVEGQEEGEKEGVKKAQEAKIGSGRKGSEIGKQDRTYQQRRMEDRSIDNIVAEEIERIRGN